MFVGDATLTDVTITDCKAIAPHYFAMGGGVFVNQDSTLRMVRCSIVDCIGNKDGAAIRIEGATQVTLDDVTLRFSVGGSPLYLDHTAAPRVSSARLTIVITDCATAIITESTSPLPLRGLTIDAPAGCDPSMLLPSTITLLRCGQTYAPTAASNTVAACSAAATCSEAPILTNSPAGPNSTVCDCIGAAYPPLNGTDVSPYLQTETPYLPSAGCLLPLTALPLTTVSTSILLSLNKSAAVAHNATVNASLSINGTDWRAGAAYEWRVVDAAALPAWLSVPIQSGSLSQGSHTIIIPLVLSSANQTDGSTVSTHLRLRARLQNQTAQDEQELSFPVAAVISAVPVAARCTIDADDADEGVLRTGLGQRARFIITARDLEGIPLAHAGDNFTGAFASLARPALLGRLCGDGVDPCAPLHQPILYPRITTKPHTA